MSFLEITQMSVKDIIKLFNEELISVGKIYLKEQKQNFKTELFSLRQTYEENLKTLFGSEYVTLLGELALMEAQIEVVEGAQLETLKNAISAKLQQIETLRSSLEITHQAEFQALRTQYQADVQQLKESFINATREQLQTLKTTMQNRIVAQESKLQARIAYAKNRVNNFRQKYETFLALKENDFLKTKLEELNQIDAQTEVEFAVSIVRARKYVLLYES
jgi:ABC-type phosphate transport system auxiliary subunit